MKSDGSIVIDVDIDVDKAEKDLEKAKNAIRKTEREIEELSAEKAKAEEKGVFSAAELDAEKAKLAQMKQELEEIKTIAKDTSFGSTQMEAKEAIPEKRAEIAEQAERVRMLQAEYNKLDASVLRYSNQIEKARGILQQQVTNAGALQQRINAANTASGRMAAGMNAARAAATKLGVRIAKIVKQALVFSVIFRLLSSLVQWFGKVAKATPETREAIADLKGALLTLAQPLVNVVIPAFTALVNVFARVLTMLAKVISFVFGSTISQSRAAAKALNEQTEALDGVGGSAKKAGKSLAGFDEINQLSGNNAGGGGAGSEIKPDFSGIQGGMSELEVYMSGALLAIGAILAFTGVNIPLGIGLMAVGALGLASAVAVNWNAMPDNLKGAITATMLVLGGAALAIGAILTFAVPGHMALGIGLMIAGAAALGTAVALNWNSIVEALQGSIGTVTACVSAALLAIGAILVFSGAGLGLGLGLMVAGAVGLATVVAVNWDSIVDALRGPIGSVTALVSSALIAVGAVLAFSGANIPLGIGLMAAGASSLAATVAVNWDFITETMRGEVGLITAIVSGALLVLGIILLFTGVGIGLGIGLILAGAAGLATVVAFNWNFIVDKIKAVWGNIKAFWNQYIAPIFTKEWWLNLAKKCGNGLISGFEKAINGIIGMFETMINWIVEKLNSIQFDVPDWVPLIGGKQFGFNIPKVQFGRVSIPRLAQGAVIPPNREFMAVLGDQKSGTNIETPLSTMIEAFTTAMQNMGMGGGQAVVMQIDGREFGRFVNKYGVRESNRIGVNLAGVK